MPAEDWPAFRKKLTQELAFGQNYQKEYHNYEAQRLAAGTASDDPHFYDAFDAKYGPIATPVGNEDRAFARYTLPEPADPLPGRLLAAGGLAFVAAAIMFWINRRGRLRGTHGAPVLAGGA